MWPEGHDRRRPARGARGLEHVPVPDVDAVEAADRNRALAVRKLLDRAGDDQSRASASSGGMKRSGSASSTENGPISSLRRVRQCPPRASAIART